MKGLKGFMKYIDDISDFIFLSHELKKADIIFIPGGSYGELAESAAKLYKEGYAPLVLPCGKYPIKSGKFNGVISPKDKYTKNYKTEWEFLQDVLIENGVDKASILKEDNSTHTYENAIFSKIVTDDYSLEVKRAIICCKAFHARRCYMYYQTLFPDTELIIYPTVTNGIDKESWFKNPTGIDKVLGEVERCGWQFKEILKSKL